jgi:hypothetical protein
MLHLFFIHKIQADTRDKAMKMMKRTSSEDESEKRKKVAAAAFDTLLWQVANFVSHVTFCDTLTHFCE